MSLLPSGTKNEVTSDRLIQYQATEYRSAMIRSFVSLLLFVFLAPCLVAQEKPSSVIEFRVTRFDPGDGRPPEFRTGSETASTCFEIPLHYIAGPFTAKLRDGVFLDLWRGENALPEISLRIAPGEHEHLLLAFIAHESGFRILKINTPHGKIKGGDRFIINASPDELAFRLGDGSPIRITSGKSAILHGPPGKGIVSLPALIHRKNGETWELASTEQWPCDPRFRKFLFVYFPPKSPHLTFHAVSERL